MVGYGTVKIIILIGAEAEAYHAEKSVLAALAQRAQFIAQHAAKLAADLKSIVNSEGDK